MRRINSRTVELTNLEIEASDYFEDQLDKGIGIPEAVSEVRKKYRSKGQLSEAFYRWLAGF